MMKSLLTTLCLCVSTAVCFSQTGSMQFHLDMASYHYDEERNFVEFYYAFPRSAVHYELQEGRFSGSVVIHLVVRSVASDENPVVRIWRVPVSVPDTSGMQEKLLIGTANIGLVPGKYEVSVSVREGRTNAVLDSVRVPYQNRLIPPRAVNLSDIELCSSIRQIEKDTANIFYKNTLEVIPNPPLLYGKSLPALMYYAELYNADLDQYKIKTEVVSSFGKTMAGKVQPRSGKMPSRVEVGSLPIGHLPTGAYTFILSYADTAGTVRASSTKTFYVYNPDVPLDTMQAQKTAESIALEFRSLGEEDLDNHFAMTTYIATSDERKLFFSLKGAESKRKFLTQFWNDRDTDKSTSLNDAFEHYYSRLSEANERFRTAYKPGWKTDRGRVFILYGQPDYIDRNAGESDMRPVEIWNYESIEGGVDFIFLDRGGFNDYQLVHSTKQNEIQNPEWEKQLRTY